MKGEKFCPDCLQWYNSLCKYSTDKHFAGNCAPITVGILKRELDKLKEELKK